MTMVSPEDCVPIDLFIAPSSQALGHKAWCLYEMPDQGRPPICDGHQRAAWGPWKIGSTPNENGVIGSLKDSAPLLSSDPSSIAVYIDQKRAAGYVSVLGDFFYDAYHGSVIAAQHAPQALIDAIEASLNREPMPGNARSEGPTAYPSITASFDQMDTSHAPVWF